MAVLRDHINPDNSINYVTSLVFFCCVSCVTLMLKFGGFKASLNFFSGNKKSRDKYRENGADISVTGAYRTNRDEFFGTGRASDPPRKLASSTLKLPTNEQVAPASPIRSVKSSGNLNTITDAAAVIKPAPSVSLDPSGESRNEHNKVKTKTNKEQKKLEKQRLAQEKAKQKQEAQELAKQEKLKKDTEKKCQRPKKKQAPQPKDDPQLAPISTQPQTSNPLGQAPVRYSTNTLESSISRSSGPPPYSDVPKGSQSEVSSNVTFSKPIDSGSWDMVSKHRQQIDRPTTSALKEKRMVMDLNYNFNNSLSVRDDTVNSEA